MAVLNHTGNCLTPFVMGLIDIAGNSSILFCCMCVHEDPHMLDSVSAT